MNLKKISTDYKYWILLFFWIAIWFSINTGPDNIIRYSPSFTGTINIFRALIPIIVLGCSLILIFSIKIKKNNKSNQDNKFIYFFVIFFISQLIGLIIVLFFFDKPDYLYHFVLTQKEHGFRYDFLNYKYIMFFSRSYWIVSMAAALSILYLLNAFALEDFSKHFFYVSIAIIGVVIIILQVPVLLSYIIEFGNNFQTNPFLVSYEKSFLNEPRPRTSGISRMLIVIYIVLSLYYYYRQKNLFLFFSLLVATLIFAQQSRAMIASFFLINFILFFLVNKIGIKKRLLNIFLLTLLPILIFFSFSKLKDLSQDIHVLRDHLDTKSFEKNYKNLNVITSGRTKIWKNLFPFIVEKPIFGHGPQADRYIIKSGIISYDLIAGDRFFVQSDFLGMSNIDLPYSWESTQQERLNTSSSNAFIYSLLSAGTIGGIIYLALIVITILKTSFLIFNKKIFENDKDIYIKSSILIMIILILRSIIESGFMTYGIDFLLFIVCFMQINNKVNLLKKNAR